MIPFGLKFCKEINNKPALYRATKISKLWNFRFASYFGFFSVLALSGNIDFNNINISDDYLIHRRLMPPTSEYKVI